MNTLDLVIDYALTRLWSSRKEVIERKLDAVLNKLYDDDEKDEQEAEERKELEALDRLKRSGHCTRKSGLVTTMMPTYGMIDKRYRFDMTLAKNFPELTEGCRISYLSYKQDDELVKVVKIDTILEEAWDKRQVHLDPDRIVQESTEEHFGIHKRRYAGTVMKLSESHGGSSIIYIETEREKNVSIQLSSLEVQFRPAVGDKIILTCKVQTDDNFVDYKGERLVDKSSAKI
ncbi:hypothetical protein DMENIID0001_170910 [Sergentomyia squamirostris]